MPFEILPSIVTALAWLELSDSVTLDAIAESYPETRASSDHDENATASMVRDLARGVLRTATGSAERQAFFDRAEAMGLIGAVVTELRRRAAALEFDRTDPKKRREALALALLGADPSRRQAIVSEPGDRMIIGVAFRSARIGYPDCYFELEIPATPQDALALFGILDEWGVLPRRHNEKR
jgi:hypothetical protein